MDETTGISFKQLRAIFAEEMEKADGRFHDCSEGRDWMITKSILPRVRDILPGDCMQAGVCMQVLQSDIGVYPYAFRQVCANGLIMPKPLGYSVLSDVTTTDRDDVCWKLRRMIQDCYREEVFTRTTSQMRRAASQGAGLALGRLQWELGPSPGLGYPGLFAEIRTRFMRESDRSRYALINAVTSVARDTTDPRLRWRLESLGGGMAACRLSVPPPLPAIMAKGA